MNVGRMMELMRGVDKRWQRWRKPGRSVLVDARTPMNYAIMAPIYKAMQADSRVMFYFTASEAPDRAAKIFSEAGGTARIISPRRAALMRFDTYLVADLLWVKLPRGCKRVLMFHGVAGKYSNIYDSPDTSMRAWDRLFFINQRRLRNFITSGAIDPDSAAARLVGYPKLDCLVNGSLKRDEVLTSLGLNPEKKTVLYAPTWSPYSSLNRMGEDLVKRLCDAGYAVIVKLHDRSRDSQYIHSGGIDWAARIGAILEAGGGHLGFHSDASPYLAAADVLITDHSSVGFEYLLLDRPLVRIEMPELIAATNIHPDYVSLMAESSLTVRAASEAVDAVERSLADPTNQSQARKKVASELFYQPGSATPRAVKELYEVLELDPITAEATQTVSQLAEYHN
jgi:hypothetical protein